MIAFPFEETARSLEFLRGLAADSDDDFTVVSSMTHAPDGSGRKLAAMLVSHFGKRRRAVPALAAVRAIAAPVIDRLGPVSYCDLNGLLDAGFPKLALNYWKSCFVGKLSDEVIEILVEQFARCPSTMGKLIVERPHGAALRRAPSDTAFPMREAGFNVLILGQWQHAAETERNMAWVRETFAALAPYAAPGAYSNYMGDDENLARIRQAYGGNFARLQAHKGQYDPANVFRMNKNIPPPEDPTSDG